MKLKYLGTAAAEGIPAIFCDCDNCKRSRALGGRNIRTRSQALVDDTLLIDFPADTYMHFLLHNVPLNKIKSCIITHSHEDHLYPADIIMRLPGFSHLEDDFSLTFYSDKSAYDAIGEVVESAHIGEECVSRRLIKPLETFYADGYKITPIRASHDPASTPLLFIIERDGKSIFYANDSSEYSDEGFEYLSRLEKPLDLISLDCTEACNHAEYVGHLTLWRCIALRDKLKEIGAANNDTVFVLHHFSHNGDSVVYDDFVKIAAENGFNVSYDGMEIEI